MSDKVVAALMFPLGLSYEGHVPTHKQALTIVTERGRVFMYGENGWVETASVPLAREPLPSEQPT